VKQKKKTQQIVVIYLWDAGVKPVRYLNISDTIERNLCIAIQTITALIDTLRRIRV